MLVPVFESDSLFRLIDIFCCAVICRQGSTAGLVATACSINLRFGQGIAGNDHTGSILNYFIVAKRQILQRLAPAVGDGAISCWSGSHIAKAFQIEVLFVDLFTLTIILPSSNLEAQIAQGQLVFVGQSY